jgi:8-oxo-dGTP pyrophosphatase MutT (NUDIX family)
MASWHTGAVPVKPAAVTPKPAATLVLLRDRARGAVELLLIQRHREAKFAGGDYVFPGGKVEVDDNPDDAVRSCAGLDETQAARVLGLEGAPRTAMAYWVGAIREAFEEVGVLLAYGRDGGPARIDDARFAAYRDACQDDNRAFWDMIRAERFTLATDGLRYFAHWITPEDAPYRYDTRFFAAPMPAGQHAVADDREIIDVRWMTVAEAWAARASGDITLRLPTVKNLAIFEGATSAADALGRLAGRPVPMIQPRLIMENGERRVLLPGDPGWW